MKLRSQIAVVLCVVATTLAPQTLFGRGGEIRKLRSLIRYIERNHIAPQERSEMVDRAMEAIVEGCDPHSRYLTSSKSSELHTTLENHSSIAQSHRIDTDSIYIGISHFGRGSATEFLAAVDSLGRATHITLDLRGNSGGMLTEGIALASHLLPRGATIVESRRRGKITTQADGALLGYLATILIDSKTASASEVVASALRDNNIANIKGTKSRGKGLVLRQVRFRDGSLALIAIDELLSPRGISLELGISE